MKLWLTALFVASSALVATVSCTQQVNVHETKEAKSQGCINCHVAAYLNVQTPVHVNVNPVTCQDCHSTVAWVPATGAGGHPDAKFPISSGAHHSPAIGCADCHIASQGSSTGGMNTNCIACHIGAHNTPFIDSDPAHASNASYMMKQATGNPHFCLDCHPAGKKN